MSYGEPPSAAVGCGDMSDEVSDDRLVVVRGVSQVTAEAVAKRALCVTRNTKKKNIFSS